MCQGFHVHSFHTVRYLKEVVIPNVERGAQKAGRTRADCALSCAVFVVTGKDAQEIQDNSGFVRSQIAFYASTPSYRPVMELHGWGDLADRLNGLSREERWFEMGELISDEMLNTFAVVAPVDELAHAVKARYEGLLDRVGYYFHFLPEEAERAERLAGCGGRFRWIKRRPHLPSSLHCVAKGERKARTAIRPTPLTPSQPFAKGAKRYISRV